jgi:hypothetical protein
MDPDIALEDSCKIVYIPAYAKAPVILICFASCDRMLNMNLFVDLSKFHIILIKKN